MEKKRERETGRQKLRRHWDWKEAHTLEPAIVKSYTTDRIEIAYKTQCPRDISNEDVKARSEGPQKKYNCLQRPPRTFTSPDRFAAA